VKFAKKNRISAFAGIMSRICQAKAPHLPARPFGSLTTSALDSEPFLPENSRLAKSDSLIAQSVEQVTVNHWVGGSSPSQGAIQDKALQQCRAFFFSAGVRLGLGSQQTPGT
jgi:hypothetical protein